MEDFAIQLGVDVLRSRLTANQTRREQFQAQINNPNAAFSNEDLELLAGPPPPYTRIERDQDEIFEKYRCGLSQDFHQLNILFVGKGIIMIFGN